MQTLSRTGCPHWSLMIEQRSAVTSWPQVGFSRAYAYFSTYGNLPFSRDTFCFRTGHNMVPLCGLHLACFHILSAPEPDSETPGFASRCTELSISILVHTHPLVVQMNRYCPEHSSTIDNGRGLEFCMCSFALRSTFLSCTFVALKTAAGGCTAA